jgi:hypothetical protein
MAEAQIQKLGEMKVTQYCRIIIFLMLFSLALWFCWMAFTKLSRVVFNFQRTKVVIERKNKKSELQNLRDERSDDYTLDDTNNDEDEYYGKYGERKTIENSLAEADVIARQMYDKRVKAFKVANPNATVIPRDYEAIINETSLVNQHDDYLYANKDYDRTMWQVLTQER